MKTKAGSLKPDWKTFNQAHQEKKREDPNE